MRSDDVRGRDYAPQGHTPVVRPNHRREKTGLISVVTNRGVLRWMVLDKAIDTTLMIQFMKRLTLDAELKVFLILDNLKVHKVPTVKEWLAKHRERIEVFYLPQYSPELSPNEFLNADLKEAIGKQAPKRRKGELRKALIGHLRKLARLPERIRQFFRAPQVAYAA